MTSPAPLRLLSLALLALVLGGCESSFEVRLSDAGSDIAPDARLPEEPATGWLGEPTFGAQPDGSAALEIRQQAFDTLRSSIAGRTFWGVTIYSEDRTVPYEVDFREDGTLATRCLAASSCEPFGFYSQGDDNLTWRLNSLDANGRGVGEIRVGGLLDFTYVLPVSELEFDPDREVLTFLLSSVVSGRELGTSSVVAVVLVAGRYDGRETDPDVVMEGNEDASDGGTP